MGGSETIMSPLEICVVANIPKPRVVESDLIPNTEAGPRFDCVRALRERCAASGGVETVVELHIAT